MLLAAGGECAIMVSNALSGSMPQTTKERRLHDRVGAPTLMLQFDGTLYAASNWSLGGALIDGYDGGLRPGALLTIDALGSDEQALHETRIPARVVRVSPSAGGGRISMSISISFLALDDSAYGVLKQLMRAVETHRQPHR